MIPYYIISGITLCGLFILFLVFSKTMNNIINHLTKLEYLFQKELEFKKEEKEIGRLIQERMAERADAVEDFEEEGTAGKK